MADQLVEIEKKYLPKLKNVYDHNRSNHYIACMTIENYIRWFEQNPSLKHIKIYCLNGNFTDGTFVITVRALLNCFYFPTMKGIDCIVRIYSFNKKIFEFLYSGQMFSICRYNQ